jgi:hypothetical protein
VTHLRTLMLGERNYAQNTVRTSLGDLGDIEGGSELSRHLSERYRWLQTADLISRQ